MLQDPWRIEMLGGLRACHEERETVVLSRQQTGTLLAYLALYLNRTHTREGLQALIWPEEAQEEARHNLRQSLYVLRRQMETDRVGENDIFLTTRTTIQLDPALFTTDVIQFEQALHAATHSTDISERIRLLTETVRIYHGELLPGLYLEAFAAERNRLAELHRSALLLLTHAFEEMGDLKRAIETGRRVLALDPLMEETHCDLMRLYATDGQPSAVLRQYQELESALKEEMGEAPSQVTHLLMESLRQTAQANAAAHEEVPIAEAVPSADIERPGSLGEGFPPYRTVSGFIPPASPMQSRHVRPALMVVAVALCFLAGWKTFGKRNERSASGPPQSHQTAQPPRFPEAVPTGNMLWTVRDRQQTGDKSSEAVAVATDPKGNIYVTGFVDTIDHDVDYLTLKYDSGGHLRWQARYNGPSNDVDRALFIALDGQGNVYVTGESDNGKGNGATRLAGLDIATIKYDADGNRSNTWPDVGFGVGVRRYNGPEDGEDSPVRLLVDESGVSVLGRSWGRSKTGKAGFEYVLVKYDPEGVKKWEYRYDGGQGDDEPVDMARDREGNFYITGKSRALPASGPEFDMLTLKISKEGKKLWEDRYGANNQSDDFPCGIGVDRGNNVYVIGTGRGLPGTPDAVRAGCMTIKYDTKGKRLWVRGTVQEQDRIERVLIAKVTAVGEVVTSGTARNNDGSQTWRVVERDVNGSPHWSSEVANLEGEDGPAAIFAVSSSVFVSGGLRRPGHDLSFCTFQYDYNGKLIWQAFLDAPTVWSRTRAITADPGQAYIVAVGQACESGERHIAIVKYQR